MKASKTVLARVLFAVFVLAVSYPATAQLHAEFTASPQTGCAPLVVSFNDNSSGSPTSWKWDLGDGVTSSSQNPATSYFNPGTYTVKLIVYNGANTDSVVKTGYITVYQNPVAAFSVSDSTGCFPLHTSFADNSNPGSGNINNWTWDFGDGNGANTQSPSHTYTSSGTFSVTLSVTNNFGCSNTISKTNLISVGPGITAGFNSAAGSICHAPASVNFTSSVSGPGNFTYQWSFGDGNSAATANASHNYFNSGTYNVSLAIKSSTGCADTIVKPVSVSFVQSSIGVSDTVCSNASIQFTNTSSPTPLSSIWNFGNGTGSNTLNPAATFTQPGLYNISLVNTFSAGCVDSVSKSIRVISGPVASFSVLDSAGCSLPFNTIFNNASQGTALSYIWSFGDGTTSNAASPVHEYTQYATYTVTLKVINGNGCDTAISKLNAVVITPIKIQSINGLAPGACVPYTTNPTVQINSATPIASYQWDFGDGTVSTSATPTHTYTKEGVFTVKVKITTQGGCTDSLTVTDSIGHKIQPSFTVTPTNVCASTQVNFTNTTPEEGTFLWWYLGDGTVIYKQPYPSHNYTDTGTFSIMLMVEDNGCYDTLVKKNAVHISGPIASFADINNCTNKMQVQFEDKSIEDYSRKWNFGDGSTDTSMNPVHTYNTPGTYDVNLFVSNNTCTYTYKSTVRVVNEKGNIQLSNTINCRKAKVALTVANINVQNIANTTWNFGNNASTTVSGVNTSYNYTVDGSYNISAIMKDVLGCYDTLTTSQNIIIYGPTAKVEPAQPGACQNGNIQFNDASISDGLHPITSWAFAYGDNTNATYASGPFSHTYNDTGLFKIHVTVTDTYGCSDSIITNAVLISHPYASFKLSDTLVCPGKQVTFRNTSVGDGLYYNWALGDGNQSNAASPTHLYTVQGTYTPMLFITDVNNCKDSISITNGVHVYIPSAKFLLSDSFSSCPPLDVNFTNLSQNFVSPRWSFGDGNTSTNVSPEHIYTYPGTYPVKLILSGNGACSDSAVKTIAIQGPTGSFKYAGHSVCYPSTQQFSATSQNAVQYLWDYSDGNTQLTTSDTSSHVYTPGFYVPKIILINAAGCKVPILGNDTLKVYGITAKLSVNKYVLCDSGRITVTDSSISNDVITSHQWIFGDNTTANGSSVTHDYASPGPYLVKLIDVTANGCTSTAVANQPIKVVQSPLVTINSDTSFCLPASVSLAASLSKADTSVISWSWNLGNGNSSNVQNPSGITFSPAGNYPVSVQAKNSSGCSGDASADIVVHSLPVVNAGKDTTICHASILALNATGATTYTWQNVQGISCTSCPSPLASPDSTELFSVTGKDIYGCAASDSILVTVNQPVHVSIANSDTLCNGDTKQLTASGAQAYQWFPAVYLSSSAVAQPTFYASTDTAITYHVIGYDSKKCFSDTASVQVKVYPIPQMQVLQNSITVNSGQSVKLTTVNSPDVTKWKWTPALWLDNPEAASPTSQPRESITYTVVAANDGACVTRQQVAVTVVCNGENIFVPNTFSPNGDGMNDVFYARGTGLYNIKSFRVFNRWGQMVFERLNTGANNASQGWDGTFNGQKLQSDVYVYIIEVLCNNNSVVPVKGNVTLLR